MSDFLIDEELLAAIDMGSNSFHLAIARVDHGEVKKLLQCPEKYSWRRDWTKTRI